MRKYSIFYVIVALFVLLTFSTNGNCFAGADDIKARMQQRLPTIVQMKAEGNTGSQVFLTHDIIGGGVKEMFIDSAGVRLPSL